MGNKFCPDCGECFDPVSGYCGNCEGELSLWRVFSVTDEWLAHTEGAPPGNPSAVVSARNVAAKVREFLPGAALVVAQRLKDD